MLDKIALGTVQFGMPYGISNKIGRVPKEDAFKILELAHKEGVDTLDTAYSYGESEKIIGEYLSLFNRKFNVISKMPNLDEYGSLGPERSLLETLKRLKQQKIYGYLVHKFDNILRYKDLLDRLESLRQKGFVEKIGASLYMTEELDYLLNNNIRFDILQVPYSVFDRRFERYFSLLREGEVEIYVRSVFLQGLVFLKPDDLPTNLLKAREHVAKLQNLASEQNISINGICIDFALLNTYIDKVIMGIDSLVHLEENIQEIKSIEKVRNIQDLLNKLYIEDEDILLPYRWRIT